MLCPTAHEHDREVSLLERVMHGTTDGGLLVLPRESSEELQMLLDHGYRFVVVDPRERIPAPHPRRFGRPLLRRRPGDEAPARAGPPPDRGHHGPERLDGDRGAATRLPRGARSGRGAPRPAARGRVELQRRGGLEAASHLLGLAEPPTAIFAFNDQLAIGAMQAARARGLSVPEDLSVVGFDDTAEAALVTPALTTVRQPLAEMGRIAVSLLTACSKTSNSKHSTSSSQPSSSSADRRRPRGSDRRPPAFLCSNGRRASPERCGSSTLTPPRPRSGLRGSTSATET